MTTVETTTDHPDHRMYKPFKGTYGRLSIGQFPVVDLKSPDSLLAPAAAFLARNLTATHSHRPEVVTCRLRNGNSIDWDFGLLAVGQTAAEYWDAQVRLMLDADVTEITIESKNRRTEVFEWI